MRAIQTSMLVLGLVWVLGGGAWGQLTPPYDWQVMQTQHFRVIFHPEVAGLAAEAAQAAEDAYQRWSQELGTTPPAMTDLVVIDFDDSPNGFADIDNLTSWEFASQVQFGVFFGGRVPSNMADTVYHEYWHVADLNHVSGVSRPLRSLFGQIVAPANLKPWFAIEGSATYGEDLVFGYSRASAALSSMYLRQLALDNNFPDLARAAHRFSNTGWPTSGTLAYVMGAWFLRYIEETYGRGQLAAYDHELADNWLAALSQVLNALIADRYGVSVYLGPDFAWVMERGTGVPADQLYAGFQQWLRDQAQAQLDRVGARGGEMVSLKLTDFGFTTGQPKWSPDGAWIAYEHSDPQRRGGVRLVRPDGSDDHALFSATLIFDHAFGWSPDGQQIVYSNYDQFGPYDNANDLYLYDMKSGASRRLSWGLRAFSPAFSPDAQTVLFLQNQGGDLSPRLVRLTLATGALETVYEFANDTYADFFALSPDGSQAALSLWKRPGFTDLYLLDLTSGALKAVTQDLEEDYRPSWTADGQWVLFDSIRDETFNLHAYRASDGQLFRITNVVSGAMSPTPSPDGRALAFVGYSGAGFDLHRMSLDPDSWTPVDYPQISIPAWSGYPTPPAPARAYNAYETMAPKYWLPVVRDTQAGATTDAWDALYRQYYSLEAGWDWEAGAPFGTLFYLNQEHLSPVSVSFWASAIPGAGDVESLSFDFSPVQRFFVQHNLNLSLERANFGGETHAIDTSWDYSERFGKGVAWLDVALSLGSALTHVSESNEWHLDLSGQVRKTLHLPVDDAQGPHELASRLSLGWSDVSQSIGVGGLRGAFMVRGQPRGAAVGSHALAATLEYRFPVLSIERGWGLGPLFFDDVRATLFLDAGAAADAAELGPLRESLVWGYGAEVSLSLTTGYFARRTLYVGAAYGSGQRAPELYFTMRGTF